MFWAESKGKLPRGTAQKWAEHTPSIKALPERAVMSAIKRKRKNTIVPMIQG